MNKIIYCVILCCIFSCKFQDKNGGTVKNKVVDNMEKSLSLSLSLFLENRAWDDLYSIVIINDSIMVKSFSSVTAVPCSIGEKYREMYKDSLTEREIWIKMITDSKDIIDEYKGKLTNDQYLKIKEMTSALTQKYDWSGNRVLGKVWGCVLKVDNQIYYQDHHLNLYAPPLPPINPDTSFSSPRDKEIWLALRTLNGFPPPEEIRLLLQYIVDLFDLNDIPIDLPRGIRRPC